MYHNSTCSSRTPHSRCPDRVAAVFTNPHTIFISSYQLLCKRHQAGVGVASLDAYWVYSARYIRRYGNFSKKLKLLGEIVVIPRILIGLPKVIPRVNNPLSLAWMSEARRSPARFRGQSGGIRSVPRLVLMTKARDYCAFSEWGSRTRLGNELPTPHQMALLVKKSVSTSVSGY